MRTTRLLEVGFAFTAVSWLAGCGANYAVAGHAQSAAFERPRCHIVVEGLTADRLTVDGKPEAAYLADKKAKSVASSASDKVASEQQFRDKLMAKNGALFTAGTNDDTFVVRPSWTMWDPGYFAGMFSKPGTVKLVLDVVGPDGKRVDRVAVEAQSSKDYSSGSRMRQALGNAGDGVSEYISENWKCAR
jgi:hypothetical protein